MADPSLPEAINDMPEITPFDPTKKKKKKKKKVISCHPADESLHSLLERAVESGDEDEEEDELAKESRYPWEGSVHDYEYKELLQRLFNFLRENNPEHAGDRRRTVLRPPQVLPEGTTHTVFVNFMDLCKMMHRQPKHVIAFMLTELGTTGSLDGENRLVVKGRFAPQQFEGSLRAYINEYVLCNCCICPDTILSEENGLVSLHCELCGTERSVAPVKAGYVSRLERRKTGI